MCTGLWRSGCLALFPAWWELMPVGLWSFGVLVRWWKGGTELASVAEKGRLSGLWWVWGVAVTMPCGPLPLFLALAGFPAVGQVAWKRLEGSLDLSVCAQWERSERDG